uniref:Uncharacterized protein n=1 Tax=Arundo donax TaxID=35708 RepID=A0A0A9B334_ARUDO
MITTCELPLPCNWTNFPCPMHIIEASQHSWKPTSFAYLFQSMNVCSCRSTKVFFTEHVHDTLNKIDQAQYCC